MDYKQKIEEKRQKLVNTLIDFIEKNPAQWEAGWYSMPNMTPLNGKTQKKYNGLNAFYLCVISAMKGYKDPRWVTFNQAKDLGANVRAGEKSSEVFYWSYYDKETKQPYDAKTCEGMTYEERKKYWEDNVRPVIKFYQVFNAAQCDNMPEYELQSTPEMQAEERRRQNAVIEQIITNSAAPVNYDGGSRAYYSPSKDSIHLPEIKDFKTMQDYYATALHEIAHSTGHASRLNRDLSGLFGASNYAKEELRAELASVFMQVEFGISVEGRHFENHGAYLASWLKSVKNNQKEFFSAASDAEKITNYVADNYLNAKAESKEEQHSEDTKTQNETSDNEVVPKFEANMSFAKQVDAVLSGADTASTHLKVMGTPLILRQLGAQNLPVLMTANHLKNIVAVSGDDANINYHGIDTDLVKKLPELLSDPVMVMDSLTRDDSVVIVTSAVDKENRPIIGAIKFDGIGRQDEQIIEANILLSVYGRNQFNDFIQRNFDAKSILYWDKEKSQELSVNPGVQFPDVMASLDSNIIIRKAKAFVNSSEEKSEEFNKNSTEQRTVNPIYSDYLKTQKENPEAIVLKRVGDFYEVMGNKAAQAAEILDLTLTGRDVGLSDRVAMCGFPYHVADEYIAKLRESSDVIVDDKYLVKRSTITNNESSVQNEKRLKIKSQVTGWADWYTDRIKNKEAREAAEWLIENNYENEKDVKSVFYDRQTSSMSDDPNAENNDEAAIIRVANEYKSRQAGQVEEAAPEQGKKPTVVNFYAGPGAGKTTAALELTAELKKAGLNVEYVSEYAKELVLEGKTELLSDQRHVTDEQYHRLDRLRNSVDVIVTDSPVLLGIVYGAERIDDAYRQQLRNYYDSFYNIDIYLERRTEYDTKGRVQTEQEAVDLDKAISQMLKEQNVNCYGYSSDKIAETVQLVKQAQQADTVKPVEQVGQVQQAENTKEKYILEFQLNYSNELLLSKDLEKIGYKKDLSVAKGNQERDAVAYEAKLPYWVNEIRYTSQDGKVISGLYGKVNNDILIEKTDITQFTLDGFNRKEADEVAKLLSGFDIDVTLKQAETAEQVEQAEQVETVVQANTVEQVQKAEQAQQVRQVQQVGQGKWNKIPLTADLIGAERGKSTQLKMPDGEYSSFVFFAPTKFVQHDEKSGSVQLSVNDDFKYSLMKGNQRVELTGSELRQAMAGQEVGKRAQRVLSEANAQTLTDIYRNVPEEMRQYPNWCVYRTRWNDEKGKYDKQIFSPVLGLNKDGKMQWASIDKPETWATFDVAMKFAEDNDCAGIVFALDGKTGISCIDLDKAIVKDGKLNDKQTDRAEGELSALAARLSDELRDTYIETSASGNGLHIFVKDDLLAKGIYKNRAETPDGEIEVYEDRRFMSMTGKLRSNTQRIGKCPVATTNLIRGLLGKKVAENQNVAQPRQARQVDNSDSAVIERMRNSKRGAEFEALYRGENVTGDSSRSDFKLLNMLAFFTDCDESQMERIFRNSGLYRADKGDAYLRRSVSKACSTLQTRMSDRAFFGNGNHKGGGRGNSK